MATVYFITVGVEMAILWVLDFSVAPGRFDLDAWIIGLVITAKALTVLAYLLILRRLHR